MAGKFGVPPSYWRAELSGIAKYLFDLAIYNIGAKEEQRAIDRMKRSKGGSSGPAPRRGSRFVTTREVVSQS